MNTVRYLAAGACVAAATLYLLIGFEVLYIGESTTGEDPGLLGFGLTAGGAFAVAAVLLLLVRRRVVWFAVAGLNLVVIAGYVAVAGIRAPSFELWGLLVKAAQLVALGAIGWRLLRPVPSASRPMRRVLR